MKQMIFLLILLLLVSSCGKSVPEDFCSLEPPMKGDPDAPITVEMFVNFMNSWYIRFYERTLPEFERTFVDTGEVKLVYREYYKGYEYPTDRESLAAEVGKCALQECKFWEMHNIVIENSKLPTSEERAARKEADPDYKGYEDHSVEQYKAWAKEIGLTRFDECIDSGAMKDVVQEDIAYADEKGIRKPGAFLINDEWVDGGTVLTVQSFRREFDIALGLRERPAPKAPEVDPELEALFEERLATYGVYSPKEVPEDWVTYKDEKYGFELRHPPEWSVSLSGEDDKTPLISISNQAHLRENLEKIEDPHIYGIVIFIMEGENPDRLSSKEFFDQMSEDTPENTEMILYTTIDGVDLYFQKTEPPTMPSVRFTLEDDFIMIMDGILFLSDRPSPTGLWDSIISTLSFD